MTTSENGAQAEVTLTATQQQYLDSLVHHGSMMGSVHEERILDALVRKGVASVTETPRDHPGRPWRTFYPTALGRANTRSARTIAWAQARIAARQQTAQED